MQNYNRHFATWALILLTAGVAVLTGCANRMLQSDFTNYSAIYGDESNKQLLLNLARLQNDDPVYYIQLGSISSQYQLTTSLQLQGGNTRTTTKPVTDTGVPLGTIPSQVANALTYGGQANVGEVQTPLFSFVPLTGTNLVQAVLAPITDKLYLSFYEQGFSADLIARTIIGRVEWQRFKTNAVNTNFTGTAITIKTGGLDPRLVAEVAGIAKSRFDLVTNDANAFLIRPKLMANAAPFLAEVTNSSLSSNDISWNGDSFIVQKKALSPNLLLEITNCHDSFAVSSYINSITVSSPNGDPIDPLVSSFIKTAVPAGAASVSEITVPKSSIPTDVQTFITNSLTANVVTDLGDKERISLAQLSPNTAAYITNAIFTNCIQIKTNYEIMINSPGSPTYGNFLQFCADLHDAQLYHMLNVDTLTGTTTTNVTYQKDKRNPSLADVVSAVGANLSVAANDQGNIVVSQSQQTPHFIDRSSGRDFSQYADAMQPDTTNFVYDTDPSDMKLVDASNLVQAIINKQITISTRTFESAMYWTAWQEKEFLENETKAGSQPYSKGTVLYTNDEDGLYAVVTSSHIIGTNSSGPVYRQLKVRPTMTLTYDKYKKIDHVLCSVPYLGKIYRVTDALSDDEKSNEEVFTMLSYLFAQTAISTQNLPVQQLIQVQ
ncbi:MAG TPA: hypothetical protein VK742_19125 [Candidatus Sulfotelmatobacter sp.]|jgi:hypothetical protein|nr:hypothetical protein [Candidatus Sulfotelmatobacter sp.]